MNGRVYDPKLGRFMSADPVWTGDLTDPQSLNPYSYVSNNPLTLVDPSGFAQDLVVEGIRCKEPCMDSRLDEMLDNFTQHMTNWIRETADLQRNRLDKAIQIANRRMREQRNQDSVARELLNRGRELPAGGGFILVDAQYAAQVRVGLGRLTLGRYDRVLSEVTDLAKLGQLKQNIGIAWTAIVEFLETGGLPFSIPRPSDVVLDPRIIGSFDAFGYLNGFVAGQTTVGVPGSRIFVTAYGAATPKLAYSTIGHELLHQRFGKATEGRIESLTSQHFGQPPLP